MPSRRLCDSRRHSGIIMRDSEPNARYSLYAMPGMIIGSWEHLHSHSPGPTMKTASPSSSGKRPTTRGDRNTPSPAIAIR